jgi:hypothetical protein
VRAIGALRAAGRRPDLKLLRHLTLVEATRDSRRRSMAGTRTTASHHKIASRTRTLAAMHSKDEKPSVLVHVKSCRDARGKTTSVRAYLSPSSNRASYGVCRQQVRRCLNCEAHVRVVFPYTFTGRLPGDPRDAASQMRVTWSCDGSNTRAVNSLPNPQRERERALHFDYEL